VGSVFVLVSSLFAPAGSAQEDPNLVPPRGVLVAGESPQVSDAPRAFGTGNQTLEMPATLFSGKFDQDAELSYVGNHFYGTASGTPQRFYAAIPLSGGSRIVQIECHVNDGSAVNNVALSYQRYGFDTNADVPVFGFIRPWGTTGSTGYQDIYYFPDEADGTIVHGEGSIRYTYYLSADVANDTSFRGCRLTWQRLISPAPAVATYPNDVPTTHPYFRFVEALASAGITGGCAPQAYCPDQPVTRGQMAVFLAAALGLHFPF
jgi:hypothetical protein